MFTRDLFLYVITGCMLELHNAWYNSSLHNVSGKLNGFTDARYSPAGPPGGNREGEQTMSTQQIVSDLCSMGFPRDKVERVLASVIQQGKGVNLNTVVDILMNQ
jgi:hypothetical protein